MFTSRARPATSTRSCKEHFGYLIQSGPFAGTAFLRHANQPPLLPRRVCGPARAKLFQRLLSRTFHLFTVTVDFSLPHHAARRLHEQPRLYQRIRVVVEVRQREVHVQSSSRVGNSVRPVLDSDCCSELGAKLQANLHLLQPPQTEVPPSLVVHAPGTQGAYQGRPVQARSGAGIAGP